MYPPGQGGAPGAPWSAPQAPAGAWSGPRPMQYEFGPHENEVLSKLATTVKVNGFAQLGSVLVAALQVVMLLTRATESSVAGARAIGGVIGLAVAAIIPAFVMVWMFRSAAAFQRIVDTQGHDIPNLIEALTYQRSFFGLLKWLVLLALAFVGLACLIGMVVLGGMAAAVSR
jgi:hypothetical protein